MSSYITLMGSEDVSRAGHNMSQAAQDMQRAANTMVSAVEFQQRFMDDWISRLEGVLKADLDARLSAAKELILPVKEGE